MLNSWPTEEDTVYATDDEEDRHVVPGEGLLGSQSDAIRLIAGGGRWRSYAHNNERHEIRNTVDTSLLLACEAAGRMEAGRMDRWRRL